MLEFRNPDNEGCQSEREVELELKLDGFSNNFDKHCVNWSLLLCVPLNEFQTHTSLS